VRKATQIIAEAGVNHNGDMGLAKELIDVAAEAGADIVKFQTFTADRLVTPTASKARYQLLTTPSEESQYEMLRKLELNLDMHKELLAHCESRGIDFLSSAFDTESVNLLIDLGMHRFKIPSGEITNLQYLRHIGGCSKPIILSTGMATMNEIDAALQVLEFAGTPRALITILHCTTEYPAPMNDVNLRVMKTIQDTFGVEVGYSDHTTGIEVAVAAVALGATVIEKHITLNRELPGPDHKASLEPDELYQMVAAIRNIECALGDGVKNVSAIEKQNILAARKSLVARRKIMKNEIFNETNVEAKRPGTGISPMRSDEIFGKSAKRNFEAGELIEL